MNNKVKSIALQSYYREDDLWFADENNLKADHFGQEILSLRKRTMVAIERSEGG